jgi:Tol biopolymer transport system component/DNA-binding winged helix-turn-helix (wHTH) protein
VVARYRWDDFVLDVDAYRLERAGVPLALEPKAFNLLALMVKQPGQLFTKQQIFDAIWPGTAVTDHALTRVVAQLRRVLGDEAREARYIETVPTRGYRWLPAVIEEGPSSAGADASSRSETRPVPTPPGGGPMFDAAAVADRSVDDARRSRRGGVFPALAAALVVAIALLAVALWTQRETPTSALAVRGSPDVPWPVQVTTHPGLDLQPALSPLGDALAYVSDRTGALEIYVRAFGGSAADTALTHDGGQNVQPAWSPDGRTIAFHSYRRGGIWVMPARGGVARQVASVGSNPAWSPDGRRLVFQSDEHTDVTPSAFGAMSGSTLWMVDVDGSNLREVTRTDAPGGGHAAPAWSRDGRFIAFTVFEGVGDHGVWLLDVASGRTRPLVPGGGLYELVFAPDNSAIYAAGGQAIIFRLPFDSVSGTVTGPREIIPMPGISSVRGLTISSDGATLAFAGLALSSHIWVQPINADGSADGEARALTRDTSRRNSLPVASPDGSKVAYMSTRGGELPNVWVIDADGGNPIQVTADETAEFKPHWLDNEHIIYLSNRGRAPGIWSLNVGTRREELVFNGSLGVGDASGIGAGAPLGELDFAARSRQVAFTLLRPPSGRRVLYTATLADFSPRALSDGSVSLGYPSWSPDERRLAVEIKEGSSTHAGVIDAASGELRRLSRARGQTWVRSWSPDGRKIAVAALRDGVWSLQWINVESGREGVITPPAPPHVYVRYPEWSPRGDRVFFERGELRGNIWTIAVK